MTEDASANDETTTAVIKLRIITTHLQPTTRCVSNRALH